MYRINDLMQSVKQEYKIPNYFDNIAIILYIRVGIAVETETKFV